MNNWKLPPLRSAKDPRIAAKVEDVSAFIPLSVLGIVLFEGLYSSKPRVSVMQPNETDTDICGVLAVLHGPVLECRC